MINIGLNNTGGGRRMGKLETKSFYATENQTVFDFGKVIRNGCFVFIDGFAANPNFMVNGSLLTFDDSFSEGMVIIIMVIV